MPDLFPHRCVSSIEANRSIKDELETAAAAPSARRRISVTDLVNPRQAFFKRTHPEVVVPLERRQLMWAGTGFHELFGRAVSSEEFVEQFLEMEGIVGKVDIYEDVPVELKTTSSLPSDLGERPGYVDQLAMYCAMADTPRGQLLLYRRSEYGRQPILIAFLLAFADLESVRAEMRRRRDAMAAALASNDPSGLERCEWYARSCDYSEVCGCAAAEPGRRMVAMGAYEATEDRRLADELLAKVRAGGLQTRGFTLNDLVFPRKCVFERRLADSNEPVESEDDEASEKALRSMERFGFRMALQDALRYGIPGAFRGVPVSLRSLRGVVRTFRGVPTLLRPNRFAEMVQRERLVYAHPHFFDRMAFECALSGNDTGRLVLYYERIPGDKFMVYDVRFRRLDEIAAEADKRLALLEAGAHHLELPACPSWMTKFCRFAPDCGCGD